MYSLSDGRVRFHSFPLCDVFPRTSSYMYRLSAYSSWGVCNTIIHVWAWSVNLRQIIKKILTGKDNNSTEPIFARATPKAHVYKMVVRNQKAISINLFEFAEYYLRVYAAEAQSCTFRLGWNLVSAHLTVLYSVYIILKVYFEWTDTELSRSP